MSLPTFQIKRRDKDTNLETSTDKKLNGLIEGELGYNYFDNGLWIGPKGSQDGSEFSILVNEDNKITDSQWRTNGEVGPSLELFQTDERKGTGAWFAIEAIPEAKADQSGIITTGVQSLKGEKTFLDGIKIGAAATTSTSSIASIGSDGKISSITPDNLVKSFTNLAGIGLTMDGATIKVKLNNETSLGTIGSTNKLYAVGVDSNGKLSVSVPWEDTHYNANIFVGAKNTSNNSATKNGETYLKLYENNQQRSQVKVSGEGLATVSSDANGNIMVGASIASSDIETALGYIPSGALRVFFTYVDSTSNLLEANHNLQEILEAFNSGKDVRGIISVDDLTVVLIPCIIEDNMVAFLTTVGMQIIAVIVTNENITIDKVSLTSDEHTHEIAYKPVGTVSKTAVTAQGTVSSSFEGQAHNHNFTTSTMNTAATTSGSQAIIKNVIAQGKLPTATLLPGTLPTCKYTAPILTHKDPEISTSVSKGCLTITLNSGQGSMTPGAVDFNPGTLPLLTFDAGSLPTLEDVTVATGEHKHLYNILDEISNTTASGAVTSEFTGIATEHEHSFTGTQTQFNTSAAK